jgi:Putative capsular polysaccharide synthesis protein
MRGILIRSKGRLGRFRPLSRIYHEARLRCSMTNHSPILVYQMGKVGSRSIVESLKAMKLKQPIYHVHFLNEANIQKADGILRGLYGSHYNVNSWCLYESQFVVKHLLQQRDREFRIISLVRDPIARNISSFFHNIDKFVPNCTQLYESGQVNTTDLTQRFLQEFHEHNMPLTWFDEEMKTVFGIDVFSVNLPSNERHFFRYTSGNSELLVMKTERINEMAREALQQFLQINDFQLVQSNLSEQKAYNRVYRDFVKRVQLPRQYLDMMYESRYVKYFYNSEEIERFRKRWSGATA